MTLKSTTGFTIRAVFTVLVITFGFQIWGAARNLINYPSDIAALLGILALVVVVSFTPYFLYLIWRTYEIQGKLGE